MKDLNSKEGKNYLCTARGVQEAVTYVGSTLNPISIKNPTGFYHQFIRSSKYFNEMIELNEKQISEHIGNQIHFRFFPTGVKIRKRI